MKPCRIDSSLRAGIRQLARCGLGALLIIMAPVAAGSVAAAEDPQPPPAGVEGDEGRETAREVEELKRLLEELRERSAEEVRALEQRIAELEARLRALDEERDQEDLERILAEAEALTAEEARREQEAAAARDHFTGGERALQSLNPEISFLGDLSFDWAAGGMNDGFVLRGAELGFQAPLDPYTRFKAFLGAHSDPLTLGIDEPVAEPALARQADPGESDDHGHGTELNLAVGEAYVEWVALPTNMRLYVGKFRQQYGTLNRWHLHSLASVDGPFALRNAFGGHGLVGLGVGLSWQLPRLWASSNGLTLEVVNADNAQAFAGSGWTDPSILLRHTGFFDLGPDAYFELGLNATRGPNDATGRNRTSVTGIDFNFLWEPVRRARYRNVELRGEWIHAAAERDEGATIRSDSCYAYLSMRLSRRWIVGLRFDDAELPYDRFELFDPHTLEVLPFRPGLTERALTPFLTWWQSEFVRLRLQYQHASRDFLAHWGGDDDDRLWVQVTFAAGPHKHESY